MWLCVLKIENAFCGLNLLALTPCLHFTCLFNEKACICWSMLASISMHWNQWFWLECWVNFVLKSLILSILESHNWLQLISSDGNIVNNVDSKCCIFSEYHLQIYCETSQQNCVKSKEKFFTNTTFNCYLFTLQTINCL